MTTFMCMFEKIFVLPFTANFNALLRIYSLEPESEKGKQALSMCLHTLTMMAKGGIHDHIAQVCLIMAKTCFKTFHLFYYNYILKFININ